MSIKEFFNKLLKKQNEDFDNEFDDEPGVYSIGTELVDGAVKGYGMIELMGSAISVYENTYVPIGITVFENEWIFVFDKTSEDSEGFIKSEETTVRVPCSAEDERIPVVVEGIEFVWDDVDGFFRWIPYEQAQSVRKFNNYIEYFSNGELRIEKRYADLNVSDEAKEYACIKCADYYSFNVHDGSYAPVLFEMPALFDKKERIMTSRFEYFQAEKCSAVNDVLCTKRYIEKKYKGKDVPFLYEIYQQNEDRILREPDDI